MTAPLYLDTARLGRMSPGARRAQRDFAELAGDEGGSVCFERLLRLGTGSATPCGPSRYPGLAGWGGIEALKHSLRELAGSSPDLPVLLANRSAQLMKLAARLLFHTSGNVLVTDLGWPGYHDMLAAECRRAGRRITTAPVCQAILERRAGEDELVESICAQYSRNRCDGLFLTTVSSLGVRLPVERIVRTLEAAYPVWFVVLDGAQDYCHVTADLRNEYCDLYLTGAHKWLSAYYPLGLGFYGRRRTSGFVETVLADMTKRGHLDDPLLRFTAQLEAGTPDGLSETVNLAPLFACYGATLDAAATDRSVRFRNLDRAVQLAAGTGWRTVLPEPAFRSGILLLRAERAAIRQADPAALRCAFHDRGVALTAYEGGLIRISMPNVEWQSGELTVLRDALRTSA